MRGRYCACVFVNHAVLAWRQASDYVVVIVKLGPSVVLQATTVKVSLSSSFWDVFEGLSTYFSGRKFSPDDILSGGVYWQGQAVYFLKYTMCTTSP